MSERPLRSLRLATGALVALVLAVIVGACSGTSSKKGLTGPNGTATLGSESTLSSESGTTSSGTVAQLQKGATKSHDVPRAHVVEVLDLYIASRKHIVFDGDIDRSANSGDVKIDNDGTTYELRSDGNTIWISGAPLAPITGGKTWAAVSSSDAAAAGLSKLSDTTVFDPLYALAGITTVTGQTRSGKGTVYKLDIDLDKAQSALPADQAAALHKAFNASGTNLAVTGEATLANGYITHLQLRATSNGAPLVGAELTLTNLDKPITITPPAPTDVTAVTPQALQQALPSS